LSVGAANQHSKQELEFAARGAEWCQHVWSEQVGTTAYVACGAVDEVCQRSPPPGLSKHR
jgi:hypothetical protein